MNLWKNLKHLMSVHNVSGKDLASLLGIKESTISGYRNGKVEPPLNKVVQLAQYFNVNLDDFVNVDMSKKGIKEKSIQSNENDQIIIDFLFNEVIRLRAERIAEGANERTLDDKLLAMIQEARGKEE